MISVQYVCVLPDALSSLEVTKILTKQTQLIGIEKKKRGATSYHDIYFEKNIKFVEYNGVNPRISTGKNHTQVNFLVINFDLILFLLTGIVSTVDKKTKTCTVSFDDNTVPPMYDVSFDNIDTYMDQTAYFRSTGTVSDVVGLFTEHVSRFTVDTYMCLTSKQNTIPIVLPYDFDATGFTANAIMSPVGDAICLDDNSFDTTAEKLSMQIVAKDRTNFYVSNYCCLQVTVILLITVFFESGQVHVPRIW